MRIKAFNREFNVSINAKKPALTPKILQLIETKRVDLLKELNDFSAIASAEFEKVNNVAYEEYKKVSDAAFAKYEKVSDASYAEYQQKLINKIDNLLKRV